MPLHAASHVLTTIQMSIMAWCSSMRRFVDDFKRKNIPLHCLMNNAGVENPPDRRTPEGLDVSCPLLTSPAALHA